MFGPAFCRGVPFFWYTRFALRLWYTDFFLLWYTCQYYTSWYAGFSLVSSFFLTT